MLSSYIILVVFVALVHAGDTHPDVLNRSKPVWVYVIPDSKVQSDPRFEAYRATAPHVRSNPKGMTAVHLRVLTLDHAIPHLKPMIAATKDPVYLVRVPNPRAFDLMQAADGWGVKPLGATFFVPFAPEWRLIIDRRIPVGDTTGCGRKLLAVLSNKAPVANSMFTVTQHLNDATKDALVAAAGEFDYETVLNQISGVEPLLIDGQSVLIKTRFSWNEENEIVANYFREWLAANAKCDTAFLQPFQAGKQAKTTRNVVCERKGSEKPEEIVVIGAHFDSISNEKTVNKDQPVAPGAVDDGSGVVTVLGLAYAFAQITPRRTLRFVLFSGEEQGIYGSYYYAQDALAKKEQIVAALCMDMTGYSSKYYGVTFEGTEDPPIVALQTAAQKNADVYATKLQTRHSPDSWGSDHVPFQEAGYPAILFIEKDDVDYPDYHALGDTVENVNFDQLADIARVVAGTCYDLVSP